MLLVICWSSELGVEKAIEEAKEEAAEGKEEGGEGGEAPPEAPKEVKYTNHAAAVFAALSPNNGYLGNLRDTDRLLQAVAAGGSWPKVSTYGTNRSKAARIALGEPPLMVLSGRKVRSFFVNITCPWDEHTVTVDGHMHNAWHGERKPLTARRPRAARVKMTPLIYDEIAADVRQLAREAGLPPWAVQATIWLAWRRLNKILSEQLWLWDADVEVSGLGFTRLE